MNDLIDVANDKVREMKTIPVLYGLTGTGKWVLGFTLLHLIGAIAFASILKLTATIGIALGGLLLIVANIAVQRDTTPDSALKVLPMFHVAMIIYTTSIILSYFI
jgi:4-hydroxybenzoate polyprenyltransferase